MTTLLTAAAAVVVASALTAQDVEFYGTRSVKAIDFYAQVPVRPVAQDPAAPSPVPKPDEPADQPEETSATQKATGTDSYQRAFEQAKETGHGKEVLFTFGDAHAEQVNRFLSMLKKANIELPAIVDLHDVDDKTAQTARAAISEDYRKPYLHTVHAGGYGHGPQWWPLESMDTAEKYRQWKSTNTAPISRAGSGYPVLRQIRRTFFRPFRRGGG